MDLSSLMPDFKDEHNGNKAHFVVMLVGGILGPLFLAGPLGLPGAIAATFGIGELLIVLKEARDAGYLAFLSKIPFIGKYFEKTTGWSWQDVVAGEMGLIPPLLAWLGLAAAMV